VRILVCGSRSKKLDKGFVKKELDHIREFCLAYSFEDKIFEVVEGCCKDSADEVAEEWAQEKGIKVHHFPSHSGDYLQRDVRMVEFLGKDDLVLAFWDGFSIGTAFTIATAVRLKKVVIINGLVEVKEEDGTYVPV
jgi:hypothetical protein